MVEGRYRILAINPGSTSTKLALFEDDRALAKWNLDFDAAAFTGSYRVLDQLDARMRTVKDCVERGEIDLGGLDIVVSRGPSLHCVRGGAYAIDDYLLEMLRVMPRIQHACSLGSFIASELARPHGTPAIFFDSPASDEADEIVHLTGVPESRRMVICHCLNSKMVAREAAARMGRRYEDCDFIVAHLGGGISISFHSGGRVVDSLFDDEGPMSPQRAGRLPAVNLIDLCYSGRYTKEEMTKKIRGGGGLQAYFGVQDVREIEARIRSGDERARELYWLMAYQVAKGIAELSAVRCGKVDRIIITGGIAYSEMFTGWLKERVAYLGPVEVIPGEREMEALARGALRVLRGEESPKEYRWLPEGYASIEALARARSGDPRPGGPS